MRTPISLIIAIALVAPAGVSAQDKTPRKLRILLIADGPTREFQFVRNALVRDAKTNGQELAIFMQTKAQAAEEKVEGMRVLKELPDRASAGKEKGPSLSDYDVVVAFDVNWVELSAKQRSAIKDWVSKHAGGIIFVAGPVNTHQLRKSNKQVDDIKSILPVEVVDARLHGIGLGKPNERPYALKFTATAKFKLDRKGEEANAGWNEFFWDDEKFKPDKESKPKRGFFNAYPVSRVMPDAEVLATMDRHDGKSIPFLVGQRYGNGKTLFLGSAETWRLRAYNEDYFDKLWTTLVEYVAPANPGKKN